MYLKNKISILLSSLVLAWPVQAQVQSFEDEQAISGWSVSNGSLALSDVQNKLGKTSLRIDWKPGAVVGVGTVQGLEKASQSANGGIAVWIYNEKPVDGAMTFAFQDAQGKDICTTDFRLQFHGWRCLWNKFTDDMGKERKQRLEKAEIRFPDSGQGGVIYIDYLEFTPRVNWQEMSDAQASVNRTDFTFIPDFMGYREAQPDYSKTIEATPEQIALITDRLDAWYFGSGNSNHLWVKRRAEKEAAFIKRGVRASGKYSFSEPLFAMAFPKTIAGEKTTYFMDLNRNVLIPLAYDYRKNGNEESLEKALNIFDWFHEQGWADGSAMGTLALEKLRSAGYFHAFYLLKDKFSPEVLQRELNTMRWMSLFGVCYDLPAYPGEVADNLRALALPKLIYALSLTDERERQTALTAFRDYMDNALDYAPGYYGTFKSDGSGYHHRGSYYSAYYPHALYAGALIAYLLHDTPYALSKTTLAHIKRGLLTFRFFSANLSVPSGTVGRFPNGQEVLHELLPAYVYAAYAYRTPDASLLAAAKRLVQNNRTAAEKVIDNVNSNMAYTATIGEAEFLSRALTSLIPAEEAPKGSLFLPYSGLLVVKNPQYHFNVKGFSKYIWDYETSATENLAGRYLSYGQIETFDLLGGFKSYNPKAPGFDWSYLPGTTSLVMSFDELKKKEHLKGFGEHRNFSDESFLAGVAVSEQVAMFSFRMHDCAYNQTFRANKSVFFFDDVLLCMGSDIQNDDQVHSTVTTLFQSMGEEKLASAKKVGKGYLLTDHAGIVYAVQGQQPELKSQEACTVASIVHGQAPQESSYLYYMVTGQGKKLARKLLSGSSPIEIIRQDNSAHIIRHQEKGLVYAALFSSDETYENLPVASVNVPLAYIWKQEDDGSATLTLCEPDMRRPAVNHMGKLTEADVLTEEKPFLTRITLQGEYEAVADGGSMEVSYEKGHTVLALTTIEARKYTIRLAKK